MAEIYCGQATKYTVNLSDEERDALHALITKGTAKAGVLTRARILLAADRNDPDAAIAYALHCSPSRVADARKHCVTEGLDRALYEAPRPGAARKLDGPREAFTIALACTEPPEGHTRWTMQLLADKLVTLDVVKTISDECVRETLKKGAPNRGSRPTGASPR